MFGKILTHLDAQKADANELRLQLEYANNQAIKASQTNTSSLEAVLELQRQNSEAERSKLLSQIKLLIEESDQRQGACLQSQVNCIRSNIISSGDQLGKASNSYKEGMEQWSQKDDELLGEITDSRDTIESKMRNDWTVRTSSLPPVEVNINATSYLTNEMRPSRKPPSRSIRRQFRL